VNVELFATDADRREAVRALLPDIDRISDPVMRDAVIQTWTAAWELSGWARIEDCPLFIPSVKDPAVGIEHLRGVVGLSICMADFVEQNHQVSVQRDVLLAGALLHDVGKLLEYAPPASGTPRGKLLRHSISGAHLALANGLPIEVAHVIAAHSKEGNFAPRSLEAAIVMMADHLGGATILMRVANSPLDYLWPGQSDKF